MKASEMIKLLEYRDAFKAPKPKRSSKKDFDYDLKDVSITALIHREIERSEALSKLLKDLEKINKKEEKKDEKSWSIATISTFYIATFPIIGPLAVLGFRSLMHGG
jgi:hypothetical protein